MRIMFFPNPSDLYSQVDVGSLGFMLSPKKEYYIHTETKYTM